LMETLPDAKEQEISNIKTKGYVYLITYEIYAD
jgi:hypothetical protein